MVEEYLTGCQESKSFSGTIVQFDHGRFNLLVGDGGKVSVLGEILPDKSVGIFVGAALPGCIGMREIEFSIQLFADGFVPGEFFAVVRSNGEHMIPVWFEQADNGLLDCCCSFAFNFPYQCETGLAFDHADDGLLVILANDGVSFPVANAASCLDDSRALLDGLAIGNDAAPIRLAIPLLALFLATQMLPQFPAHFLVGVDPLVNRLVTDRRVVADLFGTPLLTKPIMHKLPRILIDSSCIDCAPDLGKAMCLLWTIAAPTPVSG